MVTMLQSNDQVVSPSKDERPTDIRDWKSFCTILGRRASASFSTIGRIDSICSLPSKPSESNKNGRPFDISLLFGEALWHGSRRMSAVLALFGGQNRAITRTWEGASLWVTCDGPEHDGGSPSFRTGMGPITSFFRNRCVQQHLTRSDLSYVSTKITHLLIRRMDDPAYICWNSLAISPPRCSWRPFL